jgi:hypothetical protein
MLEKMLHHKLLREGEQGQGVVTKRRDQAAESSSSSYSMMFEIEGHITFADGTQTEFRSEWLNSRKVGDIEESAIVPIRYDAADHSKVVLDVVALEAKKQAAKAQAEDALDEQTAKAIAEADAQAAQANAETERQQLS